MHPGNTDVLDDLTDYDLYRRDTDVPLTRGLWQLRPSVCHSPFYHVSGLTKYDRCHCSVSQDTSRPPEWVCAVPKSIPTSPVAAPPEQVEVFVHATYEDNLASLSDKGVVCIGRDRLGQLQRDKSDGLSFRSDTVSAT